jgi:hypothetical protein
LFWKTRKCSKKIEWKIATPSVASSDTRGRRSIYSLEKTLSLLWTLEDRTAVSLDKYKMTPNRKLETKTVTHPLFPKSLHLRSNTHRLVGGGGVESPDQSARVLSQFPIVGHHARTCFQGGNGGTVESDYQNFATLANKPNAYPQPCNCIGHSTEPRQGLELNGEQRSEQGSDVRGGGHRTPLIQITTEVVQETARAPGEREERGHSLDVNIQCPV